MLNEHYWFCQPHAAEYNKQWNFFAGNYHEYEEDKKRRLGEDGAKPRRIRYKPITR